MGSNNEECRRSIALMKEISFSLRRMSTHLGYTVPHLSVLADLLVMAHKLDIQADRLEEGMANEEFAQAWSLSLDRARQAMSSE